MVPRGYFPPPKFRGGDTISYNEFAAMQPLIKTAQETQSRQQVAQTGAEGRQGVADTRAQVSQAIARLKAQGASDANIVKMLLGTAEEEGRQERAAASEADKTERAKIDAGARLGAAKIRASGGMEQVDLKVIADQARSLRSLISQFARADKMFILPGLNITLGQAEQDLARYDAEVARRTGMSARPPNEGPQLPPQKPAAKPAAGGGKLVQMRFPSGNVRSVPEQDVMEAQSKYKAVIVNGP
jgi:hypothetical protein